MGTIPVSYPLWDWNASNGNATAEQTIAAYTAATTKGLCEDFSRLVWNDIIDTLNELLVSLGMEWDNSYTTLEDAKILVANGPLMGPAFNSVRYNIEKAAFTTWKWEFDFLLKDQGYVGRNDFRGVSLWGMIKADKVYGWYIIELTRKLNVLIELMRGTWPVAELFHTVTFETTSIVGVNPLPAIRLFFENESKTTLETLFKVIHLINVKGNIPSESEYIASALTRQAILAKILNQSKSDELMKLHAAPAKVMSHHGKTESTHEVKAAVIPTASFPGVFEINTQTAVSFKASPRLAKSKVRHDSVSDVVSSVDVKSTLQGAAVCASKGNYKVNLWAKDVEMLDVVIESLSHSVATISQLEPLLFGVVDASKADSIVELAYLPAFTFATLCKGSSYVETNMDSLESIAISSALHSGSSYTVDATVQKAAFLRGSLKALSRNNSKLVKLLSVAPCITHEVVSKCEAEFMAAFVTSTSGLVKSTSSNKVDLLPTDVVSIKSVEDGKSDQLSKLIRLDPLPVKGYVQSDGNWHVKIHYAPPARLKVQQVKSSTDLNAELAKADPVHTSLKNIASTKDAVKVVGGSARALREVKSAETQVESSLGQIVLQNQTAIPKSESESNVLLGSAWDPPTWIGDGLWFRQLYDAVQTDDVLEVI